MNDEVFFCKPCNYSTCKRGNYNRHLKTRKHKDKVSKLNEKKKNKISQKKQKIKKQEVKKETKKQEIKKQETVKEIINLDIKNNDNNPKVELKVQAKTLTKKYYNCQFCNFKTISKKVYIDHIQNFTHEDEATIDNNSNIVNLQESLNKILKEQENLKKLIPKSGGNTIINNKLSINVFLNTQCKEAMSIQDFLNQLQLSLDDLNYTKNNGFVEGISNVFVKQLVDLDPKDRPIHCSNKKRLEFYVKNTNSWEKDDNTENLNRAIGDVQKKQIEMLNLWEKNNPGWDKDEKLIMERLEIAKSLCGSITHADRNKDNKLIRKKLSENIDLDITILDK